MGLCGDCVGTSSLQHWVALVKLLEASSDRGQLEEVTVKELY